jgi:two-component system LytT family response regulator
MINAIIIDDEEHCVARLRSLLAKHCADSVMIKGVFDSVETGLKAVENLQPDLVFLDVMLHDKTGFDILKQLPAVDFEVIFTTAFEHYAVPAFRFSALDYLLKPIDPDDLQQAVEKLKKKTAADNLPERLSTLFHNLKGFHSGSHRIAVPTVSGINFIQVGDIIRCQSEINYTILFLKDKQKITVARTLKEFEELLGGHDFFRIHNSHLINLGCVKSYNRGKGGYVTMTDNSLVEVATRRKEEFLKRMMME